MFSIYNPNPYVSARYFCGKPDHKFHRPYTCEFLTVSAKFGKHESSFPSVPQYNTAAIHDDDIYRYLKPTPLNFPSDKNIFHDYSTLKGSDGHL